MLQPEDQVSLKNLLYCVGVFELLILANYGCLSIYENLDFNHFPLLVRVESVPHPEVFAVELEQIKASYAVEDRSWATVSKDRRVCAMGKYNMQDDRE